MRLAPALALVGLLVAGPARADTFHLRGDKVKVEGTFLGCRNIDDEERARELFLSKYASAFLEFSGDHTGSCAGIDTDHIGMVEDISLMHGLTCIRPQGRAYCY